MNKTDNSVALDSAQAVISAENGFAALGLPEKVLAALTKLRISDPTPIQHKAIPAALEGNDLIGIAQTGTGKTYAFGIPMLIQLARHKGRGLVLLPTRELALQVEESLRQLGTSFGLRTVSLIGGEPVGKQLARLRQNPHIIIATPGRLIDILKKGQVSLKEVKVLVLDEADLMLDMGFMPQVEEVLKTIPKARQTMLFSATMPDAIAKLAARYMNLPVSIEVAPAGTTAEKVEQEMIVLNKDEKITEVEKILMKHKGSILIFTRTRRGAEHLTQRIKRMGHDVAEIHSNRSFEQRKSALAGFKSGKARILVATDIAARGIDIKGLELVLNYDLPDDSDDYVHRIGRTGRAGLAGKAISFATPDQYKDVKSIERLIKQEINLVEIAQFNQLTTKSFGGGNRRSGSQGRSSRGSMNTMTRFGASQSPAKAKPAVSRPKDKFSAPQPSKLDYSRRGAAVADMDLNLNQLGEAFGGGLQRYRPYAEKLKEQASGRSGQQSSRTSRTSSGRDRRGGSGQGPRGRGRALPKK